MAVIYLWVGTTLRTARLVQSCRHTALPVTSGLVGAGHWLAGVKHGCEITKLNRRLNGKIWDTYLSGWWYTYPSEKYESQWEG